MKRAAKWLPTANSFVSPHVNFQPSDASFITNLCRFFKQMRVALPKQPPLYAVSAGTMRHEAAKEDSGGRLSGPVSHVNGERAGTTKQAASALQKSAKWTHMLATSINSRLRAHHSVAGTTAGYFFSFHLCRQCRPLPEHRDSHRANHNQAGMLLLLVLCKYTLPEFHRRMSLLPAWEWQH